MSVLIYNDDYNFFWKIYSDDDDILHISHIGFSSALDALQNMLINHVMIGVFVTALAKGDEVHGASLDNSSDDGVSFARSGDDKIAWKILNGGHVAGHSSGWHDNIFEAIDDLTIIYTMLSVHVAELAQARSRNIDEE